MGGPVEGKPPIPSKNPPGLPLMSKEQLETLRKQISVYATLCSQLVELRRRSKSEERRVQPTREASEAEDIVLFSSPANRNSKDSNKRRWGPSPKQLHALKKIFKEVGGTPAKQRIREIAADLSKYGPISDSNVYNWFQNRKARAKKAIKTRRHSEEDTDHDLGTETPEGDALQTVSM